MNFLKLYILLLLSNFALAASVVIKSNPEDSGVFIVNTIDGRDKNIGKTPYTTSVENIISESGGNGSVQISIRKEGYDDFNIIIPAIASTDIKINANLNVKGDLKYSQDYDLLVSDLFDVLRMTRMKDYSSSNKKLDMLIEKFPQFSITYEMKGMNYYLLREFKKSLNFYSKAFAINPKNREAYRMKAYLEKKFNIKGN